MFWKDRIASPHLSVDEEIRSPRRETVEHKKLSQQITIEQNKAIPQPEGKRRSEKSNLLRVLELRERFQLGAFHVCK